VKVCSSQEASLSYERFLQDSVLGEIAYSIAAQLRSQTPAGRLLAESLASDLAARLVQKRISAPGAQPFASVKQEGLDRRRLSRVLDYIEGNLEGDLTIVRLAGIACLSRFHFARAFKAATGQTPHQFVSAKRLAFAKELLLSGDRRLIDISLALGFSGQANFTRAFRRLTGQAPGEYRRRFGLS
jgi:AraC family transcriptional regulator